jgi:transposase-like protein
VCGLPSPSFAHSRDGSSQDQDSADPLVLGRLCDDTDKRGVSALLIQRQLGLSRYKTAWMLLHKLRRAMVNVAREQLYGEVEVDETWVGGEQAGLRGSRQLKGRRAALVLVAVEKRGRGSGRVRLKVIPDFKSKTIISFLNQNVSPGSTIYKDGLKSFEGLTDAGFNTYRPNSTITIRIA